MLLFTRKRTAVKAFAAGKLGSHAIPHAKLVVAGFTEPVNTVVARGAATKIADSDKKVDEDEGISLGVGSGKAAIDKDTAMRNKPMSSGTGGQVPDHGRNGPQPAKQSKTVRFSLC